MFSLTESHRFFLCQHYVDMRKGIDSLCSVVRSDMGMHPLTGDVFLFFPRHRKVAAKHAAGEIQGPAS